MLRATRSPSSKACPFQVNSVPGTSGRYGLVTDVEWVKLRGSKSPTSVTDPGARCEDSPDFDEVVVGSEGESACGSARDAGGTTPPHAEPARTKHGPQIRGA